MDITPKTTYIISACVAGILAVYAAWNWWNSDKCGVKNAKTMALVMTAVGVAAAAFFVWLFMKEGANGDGLSLFL